MIDVSNLKPTHVNEREWTITYTYELEAKNSCGLHGLETLYSQKGEYENGDKWSVVGCNECDEKNVYVLHMKELG